MSQTHFPLVQCFWLQEDMLTILAGPPLRELNYINQVTTSSLASALRRRALQLHPKKGVTQLRPQGKHSSCDVRAALLGDWKAPERLVISTRYFGAQRTIEGTMTNERAAPCAAAPTACAQYAKYYCSGALFHFRRVVFQGTVALRCLFHGCTHPDPPSLPCLPALQILGSRGISLRIRTHCSQNQFRKGDEAG